MAVAAIRIPYPVRKFLLLVFIGKVVKFTWVSLGCYYGMTWF